jgi:hypothetical protein
MTRFDEFVQKYGVSVTPVARFAGFVVEVGLPTNWEPLNSAPGLQLWVCRDEPRTGEFCANAVLTMHRVEASLDAGEVFAMLVEQQLQSVPGCRERHHELEAATEGVGVVGGVAMQITHELGNLDSYSRTRIITTERETFIAQLTVTALQHSIEGRAHIWLTVRTGGAAGSTSAGQRRTVPASRKQDGH